MWKTTTESAITSDMSTSLPFLSTSGCFLCMSHPTCAKKNPLLELCGSASVSLNLWCTRWSRTHCGMVFWNIVFGKIFKVAWFCIKNGYSEVGCTMAHCLIMNLQSLGGNAKVCASGQSCTKGLSLPLLAEVAQTAEELGSRPDRHRGCVRFFFSYLVYSDTRFGRLFCPFVLLLWNYFSPDMFLFFSYSWLSYLPGGWEAGIRISKIAIIRCTSVFPLH